MTVTEILPDEAPLRLARRARVLAEMEVDGVDILVVGREGNARYVSGAPRLWTAGSRAFGPGCVVVRATGAVHLLSTWDEGIPDDIPHERLYGISFNSMSFLRVLQGVEGAATARVVATDALTGGSAQLLAKAFPEADLVDGEQLLRRARRNKTLDEVDAIRRSIGVAESALAAAQAALVSGVTERQLTGAFMEAMAAAGVTTPAAQDVAWITSRDAPWRRVSRDTPVAPGDLVAFDAGVVAGGYVGELGRTVAVGDAGASRDVFRRAGELMERLLAACQVGGSMAALIDAYDTAGEALPPVPIARGLGLGYDLPLVTPALPRSAADQCVEEGMVFVLSAFVWQQGVGTVHDQEPIVVTADGPERLSTTPFREQGAR